MVEVHNGINWTIYYADTFKEAQDAYQAIYGVRVCAIKHPNFFWQSPRDGKWSFRLQK